MSQANPSFSVALGRRFRERREELGRTQDEVARGMFLFSFTRPVVDAIERGTRELNLAEVAGLCAALEVNLAGLLGELGQVIFASSFTVDADVLRAQLEGTYGPRVWEIRQMGSPVTATYNPTTGAVSSYSDLRPMLGIYSDTDAKAARALGVEVADVHRVAMKLWDRPLAHERDERVREQAPEDASPRTLQAIRGHVTRALNRELRAALASAKGEPA